MKAFVMPVMKPRKRIARMKTFMFKEMVAKAADVVAPRLASENIHRGEPVAGT